jgi:hypothetical protein
MYIMSMTAGFLLILTGSVFAAEITLEGKRTDVPVCGGFAGIPCKPNQWCDYQSLSCGIGDQFGTCRPKPELCTKEHSPVCGCNGHTYSNACMAATDGQSVSYAGPCRSESGMKQ